MMPRSRPQKGERFIAIVKEGEFSKTLEGKEGAGRRILDYCGLPFLCHNVDCNHVNAMDMKNGEPYEWFFRAGMWDFAVVG